MSSKKLLTALVAAVLCVFMVVSFAACNGGNDNSETPSETSPEESKVVYDNYPDVGAPLPEESTNSKNNTQVLILQENTFDGVYSPFFYSNAYDGDVVGLVNVGLLTLDETGAVVAGNQYDTVAQSYKIYYTNDLENYTEKEKFEEGDYVVYEMVLKHGAKFGDGTDITADDVLFNYYVYLDPAYVGSSTLYTLPILGMNEYRTQVASYDTMNATASKILAAGRVPYASTTEYTEEEYNSYWTAMDKAGEAFAQEIINYVKAKYVRDDYIQAYFVETLTADAVKASEKLINAYGGVMWGFGAVDEDNHFIGAGTGTDYGVLEENTFTAKEYWAELQAVYAGEDGLTDYADLNETESAGMDLFGKAADFFIEAAAEAGSVPEIKGLVKGTTIVDNGEYETVKIILTQQNPKAILSLGVTVAPKAYYTAGYTYTEGAVVNAGVELGLAGNSKFMDHLQTLNSAPAGAGCYKFVSANDDVVTLVRNDYHYTMGDTTVTNAKIKNVALKVVESGQEYNALKAGDVNYATVSATGDVVKEIATMDNLTSILVDNLGYGYICVNPSAGSNEGAPAYDNLHFRIALNTVFDLTQVLEYYPNGLADIIYRSQSQVSWAYPEGAKAIYPYDETLASAIAEFKLAGYTYDEATKKFTDVPELDFYIPSAANDHPAGGVFLKAQEALETIGITANIKSDSNLIANIKKNHIPVYALAWQSSQDPDMYQVYHYMSAAESVFSNGITWLHDNGNKDELGTIEVTKLDGSKETMNQSTALDYLAELIEEGTKYMSVEERKPIYEKALEVLAQLAIEIPTYQRKNLFAYNSDIIDGTTLSQTVTPYWGPLAQIWKVAFVGGEAE
ncbi:MAG: hypothetical protein IKX92_02545 [Clostridia bacterium]|nr:hypothetical protein [Clostridia bacterium]